MTDPFTEAKRTLQSLEDEQRERYRAEARPKPKPVSPAQEYLNHLNRSCSSSNSVAVDVRWLHDAA
jgi:hypothetical protein